MKARIAVLFGVVVCLVVSAALPAAAQQAPMKPPKVLQIIREELKPGKGAAHEKNEAGWPSAFAKAKSPTHYLAVTSTTGEDQAWYLVGFDSMAGIEKDTQWNAANATLSAELQRLSAQDAEFISEVRTAVATFREDLSYHGRDMQLGQMRYFYVNTIRVRPGHEAEYEEILKTVRDAHTKAAVPESWSVFQVNYGMPRGTFLIFQPLKSLTEVDEFPTTHGEAFQAAIGEEGAKKLRELTGAAVMSTQTDIFAFSPKMSYPLPAWVAQDPDFWTPKTKP